MKKTDEQLISDYLEGDEKSLEVLVDRYLINIYNFVYKLVNDRQAANDISQESFIKAWKNIRKYRQGSNFQNWLLTLTRNTAIDWLRKRKDLSFSIFENEKGVNIFSETLVDDKPSPFELLTQAEDTIFVEALLNELNPQYRDVLTLRYSSDFTFEEIGKLLKRPLHTVKSQHRRALVALRRLLEAQSA
ncbi:MAG: RNA polymerase sigma factor [Candidatus Pacebacteria bacterium]|nr:RNA polymerase sigma factor [Candidatus Paceibacterota bacterium]